MMLERAASVVVFSISRVICNDAMPLWCASLGDQNLVADEKRGEAEAPQGVSDAVGDLAAQEAAVASEEEQDMWRPCVSRRPFRLTRAEGEEHCPLHLQYPDWCKVCRAGKARLVPQLVEPSNRERLRATLNTDYAFVGPEEVK